MSVQEPYQKPSVQVDTSNDEGGISPQGIPLANINAGVNANFLLNANLYTTANAFMVANYNVGFNKS